MASRALRRGWRVPFRIGTDNFDYLRFKSVCRIVGISNTARLGIFPAVSAERCQPAGLKQFAHGGIDLAEIIHHNSNFFFAKPLRVVSVLCVKRPRVASRRLPAASSKFSFA